MLLLLFLFLLKYIRNFIHFFQNFKKQTIDLKPFPIEKRIQT